MTAPPQIPRSPEDVKAHLVFSFTTALDVLLADADSGKMTTPRLAERRVWSALIPIAAMVMTAVFSAMCRRATERAVAATGRTMADVWIRMDASSFAGLMTTFGPVRFPLWSFRETRGGETSCPAKALFPMYPQSRSSMLCTEWESALAADHPFRQAAAALLFFTHEAVDLEDTTVARHATRVAQRMSRDWLYRTAQGIRTILATKASRDAKTGKPIIYGSTDAHALWMYVDQTWDAGYKMWNGIRLWCIDAETHQIIHLGGDFALDDCRGVAERFRALQTGGQLPANGDYGDGIVAQIVFPTDGAHWIVDHVLPLFPGAEAVLDVYHVLEKVTELAASAFPRSEKKRKAFFARSLRALGLPPRRLRPKGVLREGPATKPKKRKANRDVDGSGERLLAVLKGAPRPKTAAALAKVEGVTAFVEDNVDRMAYGALHARGIQIGSGAMESIHRNGSQVRLKRPGCRWTNVPAQAVLNLRMLALSGRWDEYWGQPDLEGRVARREVT